MGVAAEGVETQEQVRMLTTRGCDYLQGYFINKPPEALYEALIVIIGIYRQR